MSQSRPAVSILDLKEQYRVLEPELLPVLREVLASGEFILGPRVAALEQRLAEYCGCTHGIGVASGTDALRLALAALDLKPGDEVITTGFSFIATANTISHSGARPVFVDIDPRTYNLDPTAVAAAVTPRTRALVPVHLYGQPADMDALLGTARRHGLSVVEDCAQAIGARYGERRVGSLGNAGCLSFFPTKNLGAYGDGGMIVTSNAELAAKVRQLRAHGGTKKYHAEVLGFNSRLDALQAVVLGVKLNHLDHWNEIRRRLALRYHEQLDGLPLGLPREVPGTTHIYHQYTVRTPERDRLAAFLKERGIGTMIYYPVPFHRQELYARQGYADLVLPQTEAACREVLSLPIYPELTEAQQDTVVRGIRAFFGQ